MGTMKKPPAKPSSASSTKIGPASPTDRASQRGKNGKAERAERHQAVFDFAAGQIARRHAAQADAQRERDA